MGRLGNGKTSVALSFAKVFSDVIYVPYAVSVEGQIMRVFDPSLHIVLQAGEERAGRRTFVSAAGGA
jgi:hypothetical protein